MAWQDVLPARVPRNWTCIQHCPPMVNSQSMMNPTLDTYSPVLHCEPAVNRTYAYKQHHSHRSKSLLVRDVHRFRIPRSTQVLAAAMFCPAHLRHNRQSLHWKRILRSIMALDVPWFAHLHVRRRRTGCGLVSATFHPFPPRWCSRHLLGLGECCCGNSCAEPNTMEVIVC